MNRDQRLDLPMTRLRRIAAFTLILLLAFLAVGCLAFPDHGTSAADLAYRSPDACGEGLLAARAWECLRGGNAPGVR